MNETILHQITKGFSVDEKYVAMCNGERVLIRLFPKQQQTRKEQEFQIMQDAYALGVHCPKPIALYEGKMVTSFLEGQDAEEAIATLSYEQQYELGRQASADLKKLHTIEYKEHDWYESQRAKYFRYKARYLEMPMKINGDQQMMDFIEQHLHLMKNRPSVLQHDDFHLPNLIVKDGTYNGVIDFGRFDFGDPMHDFIKLGMFSAERSVAFCRGLLEGYFDGEPTAEFWELYALYLAMGVFSSIVWGQLIGDGENLYRHVARFVADHEQFTQTIPSWYKTQS